MPNSNPSARRSWEQTQPSIWPKHFYRNRIAPSHSGKRLAEDQLELAFSSPFFVRW